MSFFWVLDINFKKIYFMTFFIIILCKIFIKLRSFFYSFKFIYCKHLRHCPSMYIIYILIFIIIFHIFMISFCISMNYITIPPLMPFSAIDSISMSVNNSIFFLSFVKLVAMLIQAKRHLMLMIKDDKQEKNANAGSNW